MSLLMERQDSLTLLADALAAMLVSSVGKLDPHALGLPSHLHADALDVLANVAHFVADADIRQREEEYKEMQEAEMRDLIAALRRGASRQDLLSFSFL
jgi:hypothetical protein